MLVEGQSPAASVACPLCGGVTPLPHLAEAGWLASDVVATLADRHPGWRREDGACPACVQKVLLETLLERGEEALHASVQDVWPLDAEAVFGALPTPLRLHAHPRYTGAGIAIAVVDAGFHPHPDLVRPHNRIRAWADASHGPVRALSFGAGEEPRWPGWEAGDAGQWHGVMTSVVAAGNGMLSHGLYRGLAPEAEVVLVQVRDEAGRITNASVARALDWLRSNGPELGVRVVNLSLGGDPAPEGANPVDDAVAALVAQGITVVAAAGNDGVRRLVPPGTAPEALTIGGIDDKNTLDHGARELWRSNYGETAGGAPKPELVAPSLWVVAPVLPGTAVATEAAALFERRAAGDPTAEPRLRELKMVTPHYQHVEGTSFAAPVVAGVVASMLQANPSLTPRLVRDVLMATAHPVPGAASERQGAGALDAGRAVALGLAERHSKAGADGGSPRIAGGAVVFSLHDHKARSVAVLGSWDDWKRPGVPATEIEPGLWRASTPLPTGRPLYKFLLDDSLWLVDPANPNRAHDGLGGWNSVLVS